MVQCQVCGKTSVTVARCVPLVCGRILTKCVHLPTTSWERLCCCYEAAQEAGLTTVHIGNRHLLWRGDYSDLDRTERILWT